MTEDRARLHTAVLVAPSKERRKLRKQRRKAEARLHAEQRRTALATAKAKAEEERAERRASSVAGELVRRGVLAERLFVAGNSSRNPVASNDTAQGKAQNRRVEILIRPFRG